MRKVVIQIEEKATFKNEIYIETELSEEEIEDVLSDIEDEDIKQTCDVVDELRKRNINITAYADDNYWDSEVEIEDFYDKEKM